MQEGKRSEQRTAGVARSSALRKAADEQCVRLCTPRSTLWPLLVVNNDADATGYGMGLEPALIGLVGMQDADSWSPTGGATWDDGQETLWWSRGGRQMTG